MEDIPNKVRDALGLLVDVNLLSVGRYSWAKNYDNVITAAQDVIDSDRSNEENVREAQYKMAKAFYAKDNKSRALSLYEKLSQEVVSYEGAESKFMTASLSTETNT